LPITCSVNSSSTPSTPSSSASRRAIVASPSMPGGVRQSTLSSARAGMTLIFWEAETIVGTAVTRSVGSNISASRGSISLSRATAAAGSDGSSPSASSRRRGSSVTS
jgi:hypothetical protein